MICDECKKQFKEDEIIVVALTSLCHYSYSGDLPVIEENYKEYCIDCAVKIGLIEEKKKDNSQF